MPGHGTERERGTTITELLEELAGSELTEAEHEQRAAEAARELGIEYTEQVEQVEQVEQAQWVQQVGQDA